MTSESHKQQLQKHRLLKDVRPETDYIRYPIAEALAEKLDEYEKNKDELRISRDSVNVLRKQIKRERKEQKAKLDRVKQLLKDLPESNLAVYEIKRALEKAVKQ